MAKEKRSFFERLTGTINVDNFDETEEEVLPTKAGKEAWAEEEDIGELSVDVYQNADSVFIKAMVAGVKPEDLDVTITRDMVSISGRREEGRTVSEEDFFLKELYWGEFTRTVNLPVEVDADSAEALEKHGLLIIRLPKIDKGRQTKVRVKSN